MKLLKKLKAQRTVERTLDSPAIDFLLKGLADKKVRYTGFSVLVSTFLYFASEYIKSERTLINVILSILFVGVIFSLYFFFVKKSIGSYTFWVILPVHLIIGVLTTFYYFPNLGPLVKIVAFISVGLVSYILLLVNNIFIVVEERGSLIPLYSAALAWVQILAVTISIPYFSGIYKIPADFLVQNSLVFVSTILFCVYMIWCVSQDPDIKKTSLDEKLALSSLLSFITFALGVGVSFIPTESFLRALFISSVLMFDLAYIQAHYKNRLNTRMILEHSVISFAFFVILLIFQP